MPQLVSSSFHAKLWEMALCASCDEVFEIGPDSCPSCTCTTFLFLSSLVQPVQVRAEIDAVRAATEVFSRREG